MVEAKQNAAKGKTQLNEAGDSNEGRNQPNGDALRAKMIEAARVKAMVVEARVKAEEAAKEAARVNAEWQLRLAEKARGKAAGKGEVSGAGQIADHEPATRMQLQEGQLEQEVQRKVDEGRPGEPWKEGKAEELVRLSKECPACTKPA